MSPVSGFFKSFFLTLGPELVYSSVLQFVIQALLWCPVNSEWYDLQGCQTKSMQNQNLQKLASLGVESLAISNHHYGTDSSLVLSIAVDNVLSSCLPSNFGGGELESILFFMTDRYWRGYLSALTGSR